MIRPFYIFPLFLLLGLSGAVQVVRAHRATPLVAEAATAGDWRTDVLAGGGNAEPSRETLDYLAAWHRAEGGDASFNWLNTTQDAPGATDYNSVHVKNYPDHETGVRATVETLTNGRYPRTLAGLQTNQPIVDDAEMGVWGTGGGALRNQLEETRARFSSNPIGYSADPAFDPCGANVASALSSAALRDVTIAPGATWSFNVAWGAQTEARPLYQCAGVFGGNVCNLAARYAQTGRALGLVPIFQNHGVGDLGGGPENSVAIWNIDGTPGNIDGRLDLLLSNPTARAVTLHARMGDGQVVIEGGMG